MNSPFRFMFHLTLAFVLIFPETAENKIVKNRDEFIRGIFPPDFKWGLSTSSYQIEGAWQEDGKRPNIWDTFAHENNGAHILDRSNGDIGSDSYHKIPEDVKIIKNMGADFYRFSISWSRILPNGTLSGGINSAGITYYSNLINALLEAGITPFATMYHWDLPQELQNIGGWLNEEDMPNIFADYARILFKNYGDRVQHWITFNEPECFCGAGYAEGFHAPGIVDRTGVNAYKCSHSIIKAHGLAYHIYDKEFRAKQKGKIGISVSAGWFEPKNPRDPAHVAAADRAMWFSSGHFVYPLIHGIYPPIMRELIDAKSLAEGRSESRLPILCPKTVKIVKGTLDFLGINHYTTKYIVPSDRSDSNTMEEDDPEWETTVTSWLKVVPWGIRRMLTWVNKEYGGIDIYITENGSSDGPSDIGVKDPHRVNYFRRYINEMLKAIEDGSNVVGYMAWSLMDNFEWAVGYTEQFGTHYINFSDPNLTRVPKDSAIYLSQVFYDHGFVDNCDKLQPLLFSSKSSRLMTRISRTSDSFARKCRAQN